MSLPPKRAYIDHFLAAVKKKKYYKKLWHYLVMVRRGGSRMHTVKIPENISFNSVTDFTCPYHISIVI